MNDCLFCDIIAGRVLSDKLLETDDFVVINNKYPKAPVHLLVLPKKHLEKTQTIAGGEPDFWNRMMAAVWEAIKAAGLDKTGYKLVNNGAGYNHFSHEHMHIMGGDVSLAGGE